MKLEIVLAGLVFGAGSTCAAAQESARTATRDALLIVEQGSDGQRYWKQDSHPPPVGRYPAGLAKAGISGCVAIGFFIEPDGTTSGYRILKGITTASPRKGNPDVTAQFASAAIGALKDWKYVPGGDNPERRRGFSCTDMEFSTGYGRQSGRRPCRIENLTSFLRSATQ